MRYSLGCKTAIQVAVVLGVLAVLGGFALAQAPPANLSTGYQAIPNFSGPGAGMMFRGAINDRFSGVQPISPRLATLGFSNLPAEEDGLLIYCSDCQKTIPCAAGGTGAWAFGQNGQWTCTAPNAPANVLYQGQSGVSLNGLANTGNESVGGNTSIGGTISVAGAATLSSATMTNSAAPSSQQGFKLSVQNDGEIDLDSVTSAGALNQRMMMLFPDGITPPNSTSWTNGTTGFLTVPTNLIAYGMVGGIPELGTITLYQMPDPGTAPTVTHSGSGGTGSPNYYVVCIDSNGGISMPSPAGQDASGYPSPNSTDYNIISWACPYGYSNAAIFRGSVAQPNWINVGTASGTVVSDLPAGGTYNDTGTATASFAYSFVGQRNSTGDLQVHGSVSAWGGQTVNGGTLFEGYFNQYPLPDPTAPAVTAKGAAGNASYSYYIVCHDYNSGVSNVSPAGTITNGNASLSATNHNQIGYACPAGGVNPVMDYASADILKGNTSTALATGLPPGGTYNDIGQPTGAYSPPIRNSTGDATFHGELTVTNTLWANGDFFLAGNHSLWLEGSSSGSAPIFENADASVTSVNNTLNAKGGLQNDGRSAVEFNLSVSGALGGLSSTPGATVLQACTVAANAGHFADLLIITDLNGGTCTTAPSYNVRDDTDGATGTALAGGTAAGQMTQAESVVFSAGDRICLVRTANGTACTAPFFSVTAQVEEP